VLFWFSLAFLLAAVVAGIIVAVVRGLRVWRDAKRLGGNVGQELEAVSLATEQIELHLERAAEGSERLTVALEALARSRARLDVQRAALREARASVIRAVPLLPYFVRR
jgi:hypothetical protein